MLGPGLSPPRGVQGKASSPVTATLDARPCVCVEVCACDGVVPTGGLCVRAGEGQNFAASQNRLGAFNSPHARAVPILTEPEPLGAGNSQTLPTCNHA